MRRLLASILLLVPLTSFVSAGQFSGTLEFMPQGCEAQRKCKLKYPFGFTDYNGLGWEALSGPNGVETDGATIPTWAQPFIGSPYDASYIRAAVIHDHYCWRHVRTWRDTHRVFYEALLEAGVPKPKALLMYYAVYLRGPKWVELIKGTACPTGRACIQEVPSAISIPGASQRKGEDNNTYLFRPARYDEPNFPADLQSTERFIADRQDNVTLEELEARAKNREGLDFYFRRPSTISVPVTLGIDR